MLQAKPRHAAFHRYVPSWYGILLCIMQCAALHGKNVVPQIQKFYNGIVYVPNIVPAGADETIAVATPGIAQLKRLK